MNRYFWRIVFLLVTCMVLAALLRVFPLPLKLAMVRPEFVCLMVIYWIVNRPHEFGVTFACCVGLLQDVIELSVWGAHMLALTVIAYICQLSWQRIRSYSIWQQAMWIFVLVGTHQVIVGWVKGLGGYHSPMYLIVLPTLTSALLWPFKQWLLTHLQFKLRIAPTH